MAAAVYIYVELHFTPQQRCPRSFPELLPAFAALLLRRQPDYVPELHNGLFSSWVVSTLLWCRRTETLTFETLSSESPAPLSRPTTPHNLVTPTFDPSQSVLSHLHHPAHFALARHTTLAPLSMWPRRHRTRISAQGDH